jgi:hypothetical protein
MSSPDASEPNRPDLVDELLSAGDPAGTDRIRSALLGQTSLVLRRRRRVRRLGVIAALAACYLGGMATVQAWKGFPTRSETSVAGEEIAPDIKPPEQIQPAPKPAESPRPRKQQAVPRTNKASSAVAQADFEQIRRLSDRYLYEDGDIAKALYYGTRALRRATPEELDVCVEEDSWILMALKLARKKET